MDQLSFGSQGWRTLIKSGEKDEKKKVVIYIFKMSQGNNYLK